MGGSWSDSADAALISVLIGLPGLVVTAGFLYRYACGGRRAVRSSVFQLVFGYLTDLVLLCSGATVCLGTYFLTEDPGAKVCFGRESLCLRVSLVFAGQHAMLSGMTYYTQYPTQVSSVPAARDSPCCFAGSFNLCGVGGYVVP